MITHNKKNILYIANLRLPTEKAYGIQIVKMCEAFASHGWAVTLVFPERKNLIKDSLFYYYGVQENFGIKKINSQDFYWPGSLDRVAFYIKSFISSLQLVYFALFHPSDVIYSRDELPVFLLSFFKDTVVFEAHKFSAKKKLFYKRLIRLGSKIVVISHGLEKEFENVGFKSSNILVAPDAVDIEEFGLDISKSEARNRVGLPLGSRIVMYTGHLFGWKGVTTLLDAARYCPEVLFVFVGGMVIDIENFKKRVQLMMLDNILILGYRPHKDIPVFLKSADVLVIPNSPKEDISRSYTSPLKLFEYMAAKRPIVASDLSSLREILDDENAILVKPDDASALAKGIKKALSDTSRSGKAFQDVCGYTWQKRVQKITHFLNV